MSHKDGADHINVPDPMSEASHLPSKQQCTCVETCKRMGQPFPADWSWQCQQLPYMQPWRSAHETEDRRTVFEKARDAAFDVVRQTTGQQRFYAERALSLLVEAMRGTPCTDSAVNGKGDV